MPMTSPTKNNLIQLFTHDEYKDFYGIPCFSDEERSCFFALSLHDKQFINSFRKDQDKIYCLLSLGYFRAKHNLIDFSLNDIINDQQYIIKVYFPNQKLIKKLPSQAQRIRIQNKILFHENHARFNKINKDSIESILIDLIKRHPKARPLTKALLPLVAEY